MNGLRWSNQTGSVYLLGDVLLCEDPAAFQGTKPAEHELFIGNRCCIKRLSKGIAGPASLIYNLE
ncbi:hypothetical protein BH24ACI3_BH24ACI3_01220 [soil metagenome]